MKAEFVNIPNKGLCILISDIDIGRFVDTNVYHTFSNIDLIVEELRRGRKIAAIKEIRVQTRWGLKEAKEYIEKFIPQEFNYDNLQKWDEYANNFYNAHVIKDFFKDGEFTL